MRCQFTEYFEFSDSCAWYPRSRSAASCRLFGGVEYEYMRPIGAASPIHLARSGAARRADAQGPVIYRSGRLG
jgi:hypothetical protein